MRRSTKTWNIRRYHSRSSPKSVETEATDHFLCLCAGGSQGNAPLCAPTNSLALYPGFQNLSLFSPNLMFLTVNIYTKFKLSVKEQIDKNTKNLVDQPITPAVQIILRHRKGSSQLHIYCWLCSIHMTYKFEIYTLKHNKMEFCHAYWVISKCIHNQFGLKSQSIIFLH